MTQTTLILIQGSLSVTLLLMLWGLQYYRNNAGVVDVGWALAMLLGAGVYVLFSAGTVERRVLLALVALPWSFRLFWHILTDRVIGRPEDGRYRRMREASGQWAQPVFLAFFLFQALLAVLFCLPMGMAASLVSPASGWVWAAAGLGVFAIAMEALADAQLKRWRNNPGNRGKTCRTGLWRYSRHPNYFFEWLHWWCYPLFCVGSPYFWPAMAFPVLMFLFLWFITGIPYTEAQALRTRGEDYRRYQQETSMFFPWLPGKTA